jgi:hypothetical protein
MSATLRTGPVWRCAPSGTEEVYLVRVRDSLAQIHRQGVKSRWSIGSMVVPVEDLFDDRQLARAEFRRRRAGR